MHASSYDSNISVIFNNFINPILNEIYLQSVVSHVFQFTDFIQIFSYIPCLFIFTKFITILVIAHAF